MGTQFLLHRKPHARIWWTFKFVEAFTWASSSAAMRITTIPSGVGIVIDPYDRTGKLGPANTITDDDTLYCNSIWKINLKKIIAACWLHFEVLYIPVSKLRNSVVANWRSCIPATNDNDSVRVASSRASLYRAPEWAALTVFNDGPSVHVWFTVL